MKTTKQQLRQIIKEELEVVLTNEEAGELFGEGVEAQLEEQELNEDLGQLANMLGSNPEELMIVLKALGLTAANLGGAAAAGMGMSKIIDMIRDYRERKAEPEGEQMMEQEGMTSDVARAGEKIGKVSGIEAALKGINTRQEFETLMMQFVQMVAKEKLKDQDIKVGIRNVAKAVLQGK
tara:strand:+ start:2798 stop:3334 length:537 start_codon:yes stop_codon:yes gene_type:complete